MPDIYLLDGVNLIIACLVVLAVGKWLSKKIPLLEKYNIQGIDITSIADIPPGTGLGSSSAFTVSLLHAIHSYLGHEVTMDNLAHEACEVEINDLDGVLGKQDQYASAYGGLNFMTFHPDESVSIEPLNIPEQIFQSLEDSFLLFYVGTYSSKIPS